MANLNVVQRHNSLFNRIEKATVENISELFYDVKDFYAECKDVDRISVKRIVNKYVEKFQKMLSSAHCFAYSLCVSPIACSNAFCASDLEPSTAFAF